MNSEGTVGAKSNSSQELLDSIPGTEQQDKMRIAARQKRLVTDTDKLLSLTTDLKTQVDKSTPGHLSVDMIKKVDEI